MEKAVHGLEATDEAMAGAIDAMDGCEAEGGLPVLAEGWAAHSVSYLSLF